MKKLALSLAFVAIGTFAMAQQTQAKKFDQKQDGERYEAKLKEMKSELGLSDTQVTQLRALHEKRKVELSASREENKEERAKKMEEMKAKKDQHEAEMKKILTPEQYQKWEANREAKMKERRNAIMQKKNMHEAAKIPVENEVN